MKPTLILCSLALAATSAAILQSQGSPPRSIIRARPSDADKTAPVAAPVSPPPPADGEAAARVVQYAEKDVVKLKAKLRYTTLIVLPKNEKILDFTCGDKDFWVI